MTPAKRQSGASSATENFCAPHERLCDLTACLNSSSNPPNLTRTTILIPTLLRSQIELHHSTGGTAAATSTVVFLVFLIGPALLIQQAHKPTPQGTLFIAPLRATTTTPGVPLEAALGRRGYMSIEESLFKPLPPRRSNYR